MIIDNSVGINYLNILAISYVVANDKEIVNNDNKNDDLSNLKLWLGGNMLSLNVAKTQAMLIGSTQPQNIYISNSDGIRLRFVIGDEVVPMINVASILECRQTSIKLEGTY